ncbi:MAG: tRNA (adenosine(37)-N6)-threonylcarbamoyltransferase complex dimerization subunit type 1 TsaB [Fibrobacter sp.]|nr:tRNA (adenosine(37)-N6)-threonylcarbamoyltransferase complex dimerization subunit type 1 TsaB [Fibrobacter sp.]
MSDLIIDSSKSGVYLGISGKQSFWEYKAEARGEKLQDFLQQALSEVDLNISAIKRILVFTGPGSFTGLRAGIAFAQGLCFNGKRQLYGLSSLAAYFHYAQKALALGKIMVAMPARPGFFYVGYGGMSNGNLRAELFISEKDLKLLCKDYHIVLAEEKYLEEFKGVAKSVNIVQDMDVFKFSPLSFEQINPNPLQVANYLQVSYAEREK